MGIYDQDMLIHTAHKLWLRQVMVLRAQLRLDKRRLSHRSCLLVLCAILGLVLAHSLPVHGCLWWCNLSDSGVHGWIRPPQLPELQLLNLPFMATVLTNVYRRRTLLRHLPRCRLVRLES